MLHFVFRLHFTIEMPREIIQRMLHGQELFRAVQNSVRYVKMKDKAC